MSDVDRFWAQVDVAGPDECWDWIGTIGHGYGRFQVGGRRGRTVGAHRYALALVTSVPDGSHVLHMCDRPSCVNPRHLRLGTHEENMRDMAIKERSRTTKLTAEQVREIRQLYEGSYSQSALAARYGVAKSNIQAIVSRATWRHVA